MNYQCEMHIGWGAAFAATIADIPSTTGHSAVTATTKTVATSAALGVVGDDDSVPTAPSSLLKSSQSVPVVSTQSTQEEKDNKDMNRLHSLIRWNKKPDEIHAMLHHPNTINIINRHDPKNGNTSLHIASQNGHIKIVSQLITAGVNINAQNSKGNTALHVSRKFDCIDCTCTCILNSCVPCFSLYISYSFADGTSI